MPECPACLGEGEHDFRDFDAPMAELAALACISYVPLGVQPCPYCDATGVVSEDEAKDIEAASRASVDQFKAGVAEGRIQI